VLITLLASGHALIEGAPGLGKTLLVRTWLTCWTSRTVGSSARRTSCRRNILGTNVLMGVRFG